MKQVFEAARQIQDFFGANDWKFCFIGGIALQRWAKPRLTNDADLTLLTGFGSEEIYIDRILRKFQSRIKNPKQFALRSRILLLQIKNVGIDISLGALFFEESAVNRATKFQFLKDISLTTCSAEDLIVFKAFAARSQDWADIENILSVQTKLDWNYINEQLAPLVELKEAPEILTKLKNLRESL
ncbi:MAG: nucleotidyl transferase AbiEii/AbiGii toxin family protein [Pyrinomonadaceae bacterium]